MLMLHLSVIVFSHAGVRTPGIALPVNRFDLAGDGTQPTQLIALYRPQLFSHFTTSFVNGAVPLLCRGLCPHNQQTEMEFTPSINLQNRKLPLLLIQLSSNEWREMKWQFSLIIRLLSDSSAIPKQRGLLHQHDFLSYNRAQEKIVKWLSQLKKYRSQFHKFITTFVLTRK